MESHSRIITIVSNVLTNYLWILATGERKFHLQHGAGEVEEGTKEQILKQDPVRKNLHLRNHHHCYTRYIINQNKIAFVIVEYLVYRY